MTRWCLSIVIAGALAGIAGAQPADLTAAESFLQKAQRASDDKDYRKGKAAIDARRYEDAVRAFTDALQEKGDHADAALYWRAYALSKLARVQEALNTIAQLQQAHANSRWMDDAKALQLELQEAAGQKVNPNSEPDEDLKLMALNGLMNSDPERALPMLQKFLQGKDSVQLKERALFVLAQNDSPKSRQILLDTARGSSNPELQMKAISYLGIMGSKQNREVLAQLYSSSNDANVRRAVLHSYMVSGDREHLLQAAKAEKNPDLRMEAIHQLGISGGQSELWQLYQAEPNIDIKEAILHSMFVGGNNANLLDVARNEKNLRLRKAAIRSLGLMGGANAPALVSLYNAETDAGLKREIVNALFIQGNAKALVELARKENNPEMKKAIVGQLSVMGSKDSTEYMLELLNK